MWIELRTADHHRKKPGRNANGLHLKRSQPDPQFLHSGLLVQHVSDTSHRARPTGPRRIRRGGSGFEWLTQSIDFHEKRSPSVLTPPGLRLGVRATPHAKIFCENFFPANFSRCSLRLHRAPFGGRSPPAHGAPVALDGARARGVSRRRPRRSCAAPRPGRVSCAPSPRQPARPSPYGALFALRPDASALVPTLLPALSLYSLNRGFGGPPQPPGHSPGSARRSAGALNGVDEKMTIMDSDQHDHGQ